MKTNVSESFHEKTAGGRLLTAESDGRTSAEKVPKFTAYPFTLGVSSGEPLPGGVVLWTRLAPEPLNGGGMPPEDVTVKWEVARDPQFREIVKQGEETAKREYAHSVHAEVEGLEPDTVYYYRFHAGYETSQTGRTKTLPLQTASVDQLVFAFVSCQHFEEGYYTAYRRIAEEELDFVLHLGDAIYEYGPGTNAKNVRLHKGAETLTIDDYRTRHAQYLYDRDYKLARSLFPWIVTWDDHDVENNYAGLTPEKISLLNLLSSGGQAHIRPFMNICRSDGRRRQGPRICRCTGKSHTATWRSFISLIPGNIGTIRPIKTAISLRALNRPTPQGRS